MQLPSTPSLCEESSLCFSLTCLLLFLPSFLHTSKIIIWSICSDSKGSAGAGRFLFFYSYTGSWSFFFFSFFLSIKKGAPVELLSLFYLFICVCVCVNRIGTTFLFFLSFGSTFEIQDSATEEQNKNGARSIGLAVYACVCAVCICDLLLPWPKKLGQPRASGHRRVFSRACTCL